MEKANAKEKKKCNRSLSTFAKKKPRNKKRKPKVGDEK